MSASAVGARSCFEVLYAQAVQGILSTEMTRSGVPASLRSGWWLWHVNDLDTRMCV